ncbi:MAG: class I SAM-dependent rRNA methyltransferase [Dissulfurimicrobium sp.]|uniref:class I SAM-dependent rRNA methyltransferase n=1 Tax=Dissulfurimicrobium sp. TaxID=2022436 RepID=UPI00404AEF24
MKKPLKDVILKKGREASLTRRHPWVFSGAIEKTKGEPQPGEDVCVRAKDGSIMGIGAWSPYSQIRVRIWTFKEEEITPLFIRSRLEHAINAREDLGITAATDAYRIVNAESDGLPGIIVDRYNDFIVCQFLSYGAEAKSMEIIRQLNGITSSRGIYERSDTNARQKEGLSARAGLISGEEPPEFIEIQESGQRFLVDIRHGHKTGFYLDQRENRRIIAEYSTGAEVLNCFSYTGGFGIWALKGGARHITNIDTSKTALELCTQNALLNGIDLSRITNVEGDVFKVLRTYRDDGRTFDIIVLDPPKFAESKAQLVHAARGYKDINLLAFKLLRPGGLLFTFSCSGLMTNELFQKIVFDAALDAGRDSQIIRRLQQAEDHPTALNFPEGTYLKGLVCRV